MKTEYWIIEHPTRGNLKDIEWDWYKTGYTQIPHFDRTDSHNRSWNGLRRYYFREMALEDLRVIAKFGIKGCYLVHFNGRHHEVEK